MTIYKVVTMLVGLAFAFMGYKLFVHGIFEQAGELSTKWENRGLVLRKATPGTFFVLFGTVIICVSLMRGFVLEHGKDFVTDLVNSEKLNIDSTQIIDSTQKDVRVLCTRCSGRGGSHDSPSGTDVSCSRCGGTGYQIR